MADHIGIYEISGDRMPSPTSIRNVVNSYINENLPQSTIGLTNRRTFDRKTILRFDVSASSSIVPVSSEVIPYDYGRGNVTPTPTFKSYYYVSPGGATASITSSGDCNYNFVIREYTSNEWETVRYNAQQSGTEPLENTPSGWSASYVPQRKLYYNMKGKYRAAPPVQPQSFILSSGVMSGSDLYHYNHTQGISSHTGTDINNLSVFTFITGNLLVALTASGGSPDPSWYLGYFATGTYRTFGYTYPSGSASPISYGGGTPYLPVSSGTITGTSDAAEVDVSASAELLRATVDIQTIVSPANDITAFLNRQGYTQTTIQRWQSAISASGSTGTNYFGV